MENILATADFVCIFGFWVSASMNPTLVSTLKPNPGYMPSSSSFALIVVVRRNLTTIKRYNIYIQRLLAMFIKHSNEKVSLSKIKSFYPRDAMLARVIGIATCLSARLSRAGIVSKRRKLVA